MKMQSLVPELIVSDIDKSLEFYCNVLGFEVRFARKEDKFAYLMFHGSDLMIEGERPDSSPWKVEPLDYPRGRGLNISIACPNANELSEKIVKAGYELRKPVEDRWYRNKEIYHGERNFLVQDLDGYLLRFGEWLGDKTKEELGPEIIKKNFSEEG